MTGHAINKMPAAARPAPGSSPRRSTRPGGHSLRAGFVTEAFRAAADAHADRASLPGVMLEVYAREHAPLVNNAVTRIPL